VTTFYTYPEPTPGSAAPRSPSGPDGVAVILQGKLAGSAIEDCGIVAMPKTPKAAIAA
jgi:hypothetical protein